MITTQTILILTILANLFIAITLLKAGLVNTLRLLLASYLVGITGWAMFILLNVSLPAITGQWHYMQGDLGFTLEKFLFASSALVQISNYWFVYCFVKNKFRLTFLNFLILAFQAVILVFCFIDNLFYDKVTIMPQGYALLSVKQPYLSIFTLFLLSQLITPLFILYRGSHTETADSKRRQLRILFSVYLCFFCVGITTNWILPQFFHIYRLNSFGPTFSLIVAGGITYAISRYQFLDIRGSIQRASIYTILSALFVGLYLGVLFLAGSLLRNAESDIYLAAAIFTSLAGIFGAPPLERYFRKITDRWFFKNRYDYALALQEISELLNENILLDDLVKSVTDYLKKIFKVGYVSFLTRQPLRVFRNGASGEIPDPALMKEAFLILENQPQVLLSADLETSVNSGLVSYAKAKTINELHDIITANKFEILVKISTSNSINAVLAMPKKLSGDGFTRQDIQLLKTFAAEAAIAIQKAGLYDELKTYSGQLEEKVRQRTKQLQKTQEGQKQMMESISHGLQTPLAVLKNELTRIPAGSGYAGANLENAQKTIDYISCLLAALLRLSKLESVSDLEKTEEVDLSGLVREITEFMEAACEQKNITLLTNIDNGITISGNRDQLREMIGNLLSNAVYYTKDSLTKKISVILHADKNRSCLEIADTGCGIAPDDLPKIFNSFFRSENSKKTHAQGMGLGLAICRQIAKNHGATITVDSQPGQGSTFYVTFQNTGRSVS